MLDHFYRVRAFFYRVGAFFTVLEHFFTVLEHFYSVRTLPDPYAGILSCRLLSMYRRMIKVHVVFSEIQKRNIG